MRSGASRLLPVTGAIAAGATALAFAAYRKEMRAAGRRIAAHRQVIASAQGPIEFAESGNGRAVLLIHGAGGGFDQGLDLGQVFLGDGFRVIAPSRFGYLGTPLPADASAEAQADAHLRLLDALQVENAPVIGVSAGAPSAMQLCLKHPDRCPALVLIVPLVYTPESADGQAPSLFFQKVLDVMVQSDFIFWAATKLARPTLVETILGTPLEDYRSATAGERRSVDEMLRSILPMSKRAAGIRNDSVVSTSLRRYPLEHIHVPTLVISAADDRYGTYDRGLYTADQIHDGRFVGFPTGGHLLLGHESAVRSEITSFLNAHPEAGARKAMAV